MFYFKKVVLFLVFFGCVHHTCNTTGLRVETNHINFGGYVHADTNVGSYATFIKKAQRYNKNCKIDPNQLLAIVDYEAKKASINPVLIVSIMKIESNFNSCAISTAGAAGLMQVMPIIHKEKIYKRDIHNPSVNVEVGVRVLKDCVARSGKAIDTKKVSTCYSADRSGKYARSLNKTFFELTGVSLTHEEYKYKSFFKSNVVDEETLFTVQKQTTPLI